MSEADLNDLILALQNATALGRLAHAEAQTIFAKLFDLGYTIAKPAKA